MTFKRQLDADRNSRTGKPVAKATIDSTLRAVKVFIQWLAGQPGYKSRITYADAEYFNLNAKDARIAHAERDTPFPTMEQCRHAFGLMFSTNVIDHRNKALFALLMLTGARDGAIASLRLKRIDLVEGCVCQDARDVKTTFAKTFTTWFLPVDPAYLECFAAWVHHLRQDLLFGHEDALFSKPEMRLVDGGFAALGLPPFAPHSFRKTLVKYGDQRGQTREQFKAWSLNMGHDSVVTTISAYCPVSRERQAELIKGLG